MVVCEDENYTSIIDDEVCCAKYIALFCSGLVELCAYGKVHTLYSCDFCMVLLVWI